MNIGRCYTLVRNLILAAILTIGFASSGIAQADHALLVDLNSKETTDLGTLGGNLAGLTGSTTRGRR